MSYFTTGNKSVVSPAPAKETPAVVLNAAENPLPLQRLLTTVWTMTLTVERSRPLWKRLRKVKGRCPRPLPKKWSPLLMGTDLVMVSMRRVCDQFISQLRLEFLVLLGRVWISLVRYDTLRR